MGKLLSLSFETLTIFSIGKEKIARPAKALESPAKPLFPLFTGAIFKKGLPQQPLTLSPPQALLRQVM